MRGMRGHFFSRINVTNAAQSTQLSQRASQNEIKQPVDSPNPSFSTGFKTKCQHVNQYSETDPQHFIKSSPAPRVRIWQIENYFTGPEHGRLSGFIHVKYHSTDIEEHQVESMNRYHMVNKQFCKIQRQVPKYSTMETEHSIDYQHVRTVFFHL